MVLLSAAQRMAVKRSVSSGDPLLLNIQRIDVRKHRLRKFKHPGIKRDKLFKPGYQHRKLELTCEECGCDENEKLYVSIFSLNLFHAIVC